MFYLILVKISVAETFFADTRKQKQRIITGETNEIFIATLRRIYKKKSIMSVVQVTVVHKSKRAYYFPRDVNNDWTRHVNEYINVLEKKKTKFVELPSDYKILISFFVRVRSWSPGDFEYFFFYIF